MNSNYNLERARASSRAFTPLGLGLCPFHLTQRAYPLSWTPYLSLAPAAGSGSASPLPRDQPRYFHRFRVAQLAVGGSGASACYCGGAAAVLDTFDAGHRAAGDNRTLRNPPADGGASQVAYDA